MPGAAQAPAPIARHAHLPAAGNTSTLALGLMAAAGGWVAVGFPATEGRMLGSTAMILKTCTACASGEHRQGGPSRRQLLLVGEHGRPT